MGRRKHRPQRAHAHQRTRCHTGTADGQRQQPHALSIGSKRQAHMDPERPLLVAPSIHSDPQQPRWTDDSQPPGSRPQNDCVPPEPITSCPPHPCPPKRPGPVDVHESQAGGGPGRIPNGGACFADSRGSFSALVLKGLAGRHVMKGKNTVAVRLEKSVRRCSSRVTARRQSTTATGQSQAPPITITR